MIQVRHRCDLIIVGRLPQTIEGITRIQFGTMRHVFQVIQWYDFALGYAVNINISPHAVFDSLRPQFVLNFPDFL